jgi:hypothetical protein
LPEGAMARDVFLWLVGFWLMSEVVLRFVEVSF